MLQLCSSKKRMVAAIAVLATLSLLVVILESSQLRSHQEDIHESHPLLKKQLTAAEKCWTTETFTVEAECDLCSKEEINAHLPVVCVARGNKEKVKCASGKVAYRACDKVRWVEERKFWMFESVMALVAGVSYGLVFLRQKQQDHKMYQRIQKQIAAGV